MSRNSPAGTAERVLLSLGLPVGGVFIGFLPAGVAVLAGLHEPVVSVVGFLGMILGVIATSHLAPRVVPNATWFPVGRRIVAGVVGLLTAMAVGRCLLFLGLDAQALSNSSSPWAVVQEGVSMLLIFGAMLAAAGAALGTPKVADDRFASEARGRPTKG